ncbi:DUF3006 domain-containing protein [Deinococcus petrolearius]|uniref:DUF3006 domain-containing protein n=1 Tax=Deinococcus petrolearius TaxID=1751295 RepID=A0ABW1DMQ3_9DEIO
MATERRPATTPEHLVIDDFEDDLARVEWGERSLDLPKSWLPKGAREGDHLTIDADGDGQVTFTVDAAATRQARTQNQAALDRLNTDDQGGDITL